MTSCVVLLYFIYAVCYCLRIHLDIKDSINVLASSFPYVLTICNFKHDRQCRCNVTLSCVRVTIVAVEEQYVVHIVGMCL